MFVRDCLDCVLVVPCGQFRLRDSHRLDVFLQCATQPIIESSTHIRFACIRLQYNDLKGTVKEEHRIIMLYSNVLLLLETKGNAQRPLRPSRNISLNR